LDLGVDIIVTDHHEVPPDGVPDCTVINPKQDDCDYPIDFLCGAGVAFKLVQALGGLDAAMEYIDLAAVATIADLVPLCSENRLIVQLGLKKENLKNAGLKALFADQKLFGAKSFDISFKVVPRINAAGRMGDAYRAFELLTSDDPSIISGIINDINSDNQKRKDLGDEMFLEAVEDIHEEDLTVSRAVVLSHPAWEKGVTGILAARIVGEYRRPTFIIVSKGDQCKGTCRAFGEINVFDILSNASDLLTEFGGHRQAAGFTIPRENIDKFKRRVNDYLSGLPSEWFLPGVEYDADIESGEITLDFAKELELFEPLGHSNPNPVFRYVENGPVAVSPMKGNYKHSSIVLKPSLAVTAFNFYNSNSFLSDPSDKELALEISVNNFNGKESVRGILRGIAPSKLYIDNEIAKANYIKNAQIKKKREPQNLAAYKSGELNSIIGGNVFGTLIIAGCRETYDNFIKLYNGGYLYHDFMYSTLTNNLNRIVVSPVFDGNFDIANYSKIIFLDPPVGDGLIPSLNRKTKAGIFVPESGSAAGFFEGVDFSRGAFIKLYEYVRSNSDLSARDVFSYYKALKNRIGGGISAPAFICALTVFYVLGFIALYKEPFSIGINKGVSGELTDSAIYNYFVAVAAGGG
jgi:single-stranded-DNA-specific exonuclease RecJ